MTSFRGMASWAKVMLPGEKLTSLASHPTQKRKQNRVTNLLTYLCTNIEKNLDYGAYQSKCLLGKVSLGQKSADSPPKKGSVLIEKSFPFILSPFNRFFRPKTEPIESSSLSQNSISYWKSP
jgi:hypothetical protein